MGSVRRRRDTRTGSHRAAWQFLVGAVVCLTAGIVINTAAGKPSQYSKSTVLEVGGLVLVLLGVGAVLLLFAISRFNRARRASDHEERQVAARQVADQHLVQARALAASLLTNSAPAADPLWDVVLQPDERALLEGTLSYSRYYGAGSAASYTHVSTRHYGNVGVGRVVLNHAIDGAGNRHRAEQAAYAAAARWRDRQECRIVVTDRRLLCQVQTQGWLSFGHGTVTAIQPVPDTGSVVLEYPDTAPLCLSGALVAEVMVVVVWALYGADGLREHPALAEVRAIAPFPEAARGDGDEPAMTDPVASTAVTGAAAERSPADGRPATEGPPVDLLTLVAEHELVLPEQVAQRLAVNESDATAQLEEMVAKGLAVPVRFSAHSPAAYRMTQRGAKRLGGMTPPLRSLDLAEYRHALAIDES